MGMIPNCLIFPVRIFHKVNFRTNLLTRRKIHLNFDLRRSRDSLHLTRKHFSGHAVSDDNRHALIEAKTIDIFPEFNVQVCCRMQPAGMRIFYNIMLWFVLTN